MPRLCADEGVEPTQLDESEGGRRDQPSPAAASERREDLPPTWRDGWMDTNHSEYRRAWDQSCEAWATTGSYSCYSDYYSARLAGCFRRDTSAQEDSYAPHRMKQAHCQHFQQDWVTDRSERSHRSHPPSQHGSDRAPHARHDEWSTPELWGMDRRELWSSGASSRSSDWATPPYGEFRDADFPRSSRTEHHGAEPWARKAKAAVQAAIPRRTKQGQAQKQAEPKLDKRVLKPPQTAIRAGRYLTVAQEVRGLVGRVVAILLKSSTPVHLPILGNFIGRDGRALLRHMHLPLCTFARVQSKVFSVTTAKDVDATLCPAVALQPGWREALQQDVAELEAIELTADRDETHDASKGDTELCWANEDGPCLPSILSADLEDVVSGIYTLLRMNGPMLMCTLGQHLLPSARSTLAQHQLRLKTLIVMHDRIHTAWRLPDEVAALEDDRASLEAALQKAHALMRQAAESEQFEDAAAHRKEKLRLEERLKQLDELPPIPQNISL